MSRLAVVVGAAGQDGRLLSQSLKADGWTVVPVLRGQKPGPVIEKRKPDEVYYVAAYHHSAEDAPRDDAALYRLSHEAHVDGLLECLEAIRTRSPKTRLFYAASSHVFGRPAKRVQDEDTPLNPGDAYGLTKAAGLLACRLYRARGVYAAVGILYNHESPLRAPRFLSRKLALGVAAIKAGKAKTLTLGDLDARADWGWAPDFVEAFRRILSLPKPDDFVVATGEARSVRDFAAAAFAAAGLDWKKHVRVDKRLISRKKHVLVGDSRKLLRATGWAPIVGVPEIARRMVLAELAEIS